MKKPIQDLCEEHSSITEMLMIMGKVASRLKNGDEVNREHLDKIVEFIRIFADMCHHGKEEDILFPELEKISSHKKTVNELLGDHKTGRDFIRGVVESLDKYQAGNPDAYHIAINIQGYIQLLTAHIRRENSLFSAADKELSDKLWEEIEERFEKLEHDIIGAGKHEEYNRWLKELKDIYL